MKLSTIFELLLIFLIISFAASKFADTHRKSKKWKGLDKTGNRQLRKQNNTLPASQSITSSTTSNNRYCSCVKLSCKCCRDFSLPVVPIGGPGCASLKYLNGDSMLFTMSFGDRVLRNVTISGKKPQPICMPLPGGISKFCGRVYGISREGSELKACLGLELRALDDVEAALRLSCFKFGSKGLSVEPGQPVPTDEEDEDDEDDDDDDDFVFGGGGDDDDEEEEEDDDVFGLGDDEEESSENAVDSGEADYTGFTALSDELLNSFFESDTKKKKKPNQDGVPAPSGKPGPISGTPTAIPAPSVKPAILPGTSNIIPVPAVKPTIPPASGIESGTLVPSKSNSKPLSAPIRHKTPQKLTTKLAISTPIKIRPTQSPVYSVTTTEKNEIFTSEIAHNPPASTSGSPTTTENLILVSTSEQKLNSQSDHSTSYPSTIIFKNNYTTTTLSNTVPPSRFTNTNEDITTTTTTLIDQTTNTYTDQYYTMIDTKETFYQNQPSTVHIIRRSTTPKKIPPTTTNMPITIKQLATSQRQPTEKNSLSTEKFYLPINLSTGLTESIEPVTSTLMSVNIIQSSSETENIDENIQTSTINDVMPTENEYNEIDSDIRMTTTIMPPFLHQINKLSNNTTTSTTTIKSVKNSKGSSVNKKKGEANNEKNKIIRNPISIDTVTEDTDDIDASIEDVMDSAVNVFSGETEDPDETKNTNETESISLFDSFEDDSDEISETTTGTGQNSDEKNDDDDDDDDDDDSDEFRGFKSNRTHRRMNLPVSTTIISSKKNFNPEYLESQDSRTGRLLKILPMLSKLANLRINTDLVPPAVHLPSEIPSRTNRQIMPNNTSEEFNNFIHQSSRTHKRMEFRPQEINLHHPPQDRRNHRRMELPPMKKIYSVHSEESVPLVPSTETNQRGHRRMRL